MFELKYLSKHLKKWKGKLEGYTDKRPTGTNPLMRQTSYRKTY